MGLNEKFFKTSSVTPEPFTPEGNFETVTYSGNGGTQKITGYIRKGAAFNGSSSFIDVNAKIPASLNFSFSFWMNSTDSTTGQYMFSTKANSGTNGYWIVFNADSFWYGEGNNSLNGVTQQSPTGNYDDGTWHHVVVTRAAGGTVNMFIDNNHVITNGSIGANHMTSTAYQNDLFIGRYSGSNALHYGGKIDQVRIFDTVITSANVNTLFLETSASSTKSTLDIFGNGSGVALYEMEDNANDTGNNYNGTATNVNYLGMNFKPDLVWIKKRNTNENHAWFDNVRGVQRQISCDIIAAGYTTTNAVSSFDSNGFTTGNNGATNNGSGTYVAWCWKGGGDAADNTDGSVDSKVSANVAAGFSIIKSTYTSTANYTVGHGLSQRPQIVFNKNVDQSDVSYGQWWTWIEGVTGTNGDYANLSSSAGKNAFSDTFTTATTIKYHTGFQVTGTNKSMISYAFHSVSLYQKIGKYVGSGNTKIISTEVTSGDGGFEPRWILIKNVSGSSGSWWMYDAVRIPSNPRNKRLVADVNFSEATNTSGNVNFNSNSFTLLGSYAGTNAIGNTYIYLVIA